MKSGSVHSLYRLKFLNVVSPEGEMADFVHVLLKHPDATETVHLAIQDDEVLSTWRYQVDVGDEPGCWRGRANVIKDGVIAASVQFDFRINCSPFTDPTAAPA